MGWAVASGALHDAASAAALCRELRRILALLAGDRAQAEQLYEDLMVELDVELDEGRPFPEELE